MSDITNIQTALTSFIQMVLPVPFIFIVALVLAIRLDWELSMILLAVIVIVFVLALFIMNSAAPLFQKLQKLLDRMTTILLENLTGVRVVRAFNNEQREEQRMGRAFAAYADTSIRANRRFANLDGISFFCINLFVVIVYWLSAGHLQIGDITAIISYATMVLFFLMMAQMVVMMMPRALECCERVQAVLDHTPEIQDLVSGPPRPFDDDAPEVLSFRNVSFRFADAEEDTLSELNFTCRRGQTTAIIGGTGTGKSTIASLILRFHDVTRGGHPSQRHRHPPDAQHFLRERLAYVQQKAWLFSGTIADNLRYSDPDASRETMLHAVDVAQAGEFVGALPDGLDAFVAQGGTNFSGGSGSGCPLPARWSKSRNCISLTTASRRWTSRPDAALRRALAKETQDGRRADHRPAGQHHPACRHHPVYGARQHRRAGQPH